MYHVFLQPAPAGTPHQEMQSIDEVIGYVEQWCQDETESPTGLCPCVTWQENGTEAIPNGTVS